MQDLGIHASLSIERQVQIAIPYCIDCPEVENPSQHSKE